MTLNGSDARSASRRRITDELLDEMTAWHPAERMRAFRSWMRGSLSLIHLHVLTTLEAEGPVSMGHLAESLDVSVASATGIVDRMAQRDLVERRPRPGDRRVIEVHATARGAAVFRDLSVERRSRLEALLGGLSERELRSLLIGLRALHRARERVAMTSDQPAHPMPATATAR